MTIKEALEIATKELSKSVQNPRKEAKILLSHILEKEEIFLITNSNLHVETDKYFEFVKRRVDNEPLEYITKKVSFYSREFLIENGVLIPRPETEILVDKTMEIIKKFNAKSVAEIGTGSGIISIMLAIFCENIKIVATDISQKAINLACKNAERFGVSSRIEFIKTNYLDGVKMPEILVSNPPYIAKNAELEKHVLNEPHNALFGGKIGDEILKDIVNIYKKNSLVLALACEMGYDQKRNMQEFFLKENISNFTFYEDLSGIDRGFILKRGKE